MALSDVISRIPFLAGYEASREQRERRAMDELKMAGGLQALLAGQAAAEAKQRTLAKEEAMRAELASGADPRTVAIKYGSAGDILTSETSRINRESQNAVTRETALGRLQAAATSAQRTHEWRMGQIDNIADENTRKRYRDAEIVRHNQETEAIQRDALLQGGARLHIANERLDYDTGRRVAVPQAAPSVAPAAVAPQPPASPLPAGVPPEDEAAFRMVQAATRQGVPASAMGNSVAPPAPAQPEVAAGPVTPAPPDNLDARDLALRNAQATMPVQAVPVAPAPANPEQAPKSIPPMPPEIARLPQREQAKWLLQQTRPSIAGAGTFTPQTLEFVAKQYLRGDRQAVQGFARNATARIALQNAIVDEAIKQGMTPEQTAAQMAQFAGTLAGSRTIGQRAANISLAATEAQEMLGIVKETSDKFARTTFVPWNMALRAYESGTGSPEIAEFGAAVNALVNVYARAINPTGVPTVSDKEHARAVLNTVQSPQQVDAVLGIIRRELEIAKKAPSTVQEATRAGITGNAGNTGGWSIRPR